VAENFGIAGRVILNDNIDVRQVKTTRGNVCAEKHAGGCIGTSSSVTLVGLCMREPCKRRGAPLGCLLAVQRKKAQMLVLLSGAVRKQREYVVDLCTCSKIYNRLAYSSLCLMLQQAQQLRKLVLGPGDMVKLLKRRRHANVSRARSATLLVLDLDNNAYWVTQTDTHKL